MSLADSWSRPKVYDAAANWKILSENYHECYHCPAIHPQLCRVSPPRKPAQLPSERPWARRLDAQLREGMDTMSLDGASLGGPLRGLDGPSLRKIVYINIFPNVLLSLHPDYVMTRHSSYRSVSTGP